MDQDGNLIIDLQYEGPSHYISPVKYILKSETEFDKKEPEKKNKYPDFKKYALAIAIITIEYKMTEQNTLRKETKSCFY